MHTVADTTAAPAAKQLHEEITEILQRAGHSRPQDWVRGLHPDALNSATPQDVQRFLINRYWRHQLGGVQSNTMDERYCLVDTGSIADWLRLFETGVAKCLVDNSLPPALH